MSHLLVQFTVNGAAYNVTTPAHVTLLDILRDQLALTGTHEGCRVGECGSCIVLLDGLAVNACLILAPDVNGHAVTTVEGLDTNGQLSVLQQAFVEHGALQCGYCTSGMLLCATALLNESRGKLTTANVRRAMVGNLCRCTGYAKIIEAVMAAQKAMHSVSDNLAKTAAPPEGAHE